MPVDEELISTLGYALGISKRTERHLAAGFPANGEHLTPTTEQSPRLPIETDPRMAEALREAIERSSHSAPAPAFFPALHAMLQRVRMPATDAVLQALLHMGNHPGMLDCAADVMTSADLERMHRFVGDDWTTGKCALISAHLGGDRASGAQAILGRLEDFVAAHPTASLAETNEAIGRTLQQLRPLGAPIVPSLVRALESKVGAVSGAAIDLLHELDEKGFAEHMRIAAEKNALGPVQLKKVIALVGDAPDPRLYFAMMATPSFAPEAAAALKSRLRADKITRAVFEHLAVGSRFGAGEVTTYVGLLGTDAAATVAASLEEALGRAGSKPEGVYWLAKIVGLRALVNAGGPAQRATVAKFVADRGTYVDERTEYKGDRHTKKEAETKCFSALADEALKAIDGRGR